jgi:hypothetical protein
MDILRIYDGNVFIVIKSIIVIQCSGIINSVKVGSFKKTDENDFLYCLNLLLL